MSDDIDLKSLLIDGDWDSQDKIDIATGVMAYDDGFSLDWWQDWYIRNDKQFLITNKSRRIGWSFVTGLKGLLKALDPATKRYTKQFVSYSLEDAKEKIATAREFYYSIPVVLRPKKIKTDSKTVLEFEDKNGQSVSRLVSLPCKDPRGKGGDISLDEYAFFGKVDARIYTAAMGVIARGGALEIGSTPLGNSGRFYEIMSDRNQYPRYIRRDIPWYFSGALCTDIEQAIMCVKGGMTDRELVYRFGTESLQIIADSMPWEDFLQEFCCNFQDERSSYITLDMIKACTPVGDDEILPYYANPDYAAGNLEKLYVTNKDGEIGYKSSIDEMIMIYDPKVHGTLYAGYDVGRKKNASELFIWGDNDGVKTEFANVTLKKIAFDDQQEFLIRCMHELPIHRICIDATGLGMQLGENVKKKYSARVEAIEFTNSIKEEMAQAVYLGFERSEYKIAADRQLHREIHSIKKIITSSGNIRFDTEGNTDDRHADKFWALALAEHAVSKGHKKKSNFYATIKERKGGKIPKSQTAILNQLARRKR